MKRLLAGLMITTLLLPGPAAATYSGFGTNAPYDSTGGVKITSEVIQSGTVEKAKPQKKTKKKAKKKAKAHKKTLKKAKTKKHAKKSSARKHHEFKEHKIESQGETLPPIQLPGTEH